MQSSRAPSTKLSIVFAFLAVGAIGGGVAWRLWWTDRVELEGRLKAGSLRCQDECHFDFVLEGKTETRVRADSCIMPDTLRDWPGHTVRVLAAGKWERDGQFVASALLTKVGYEQGKKPSGGRPPACFIPPERR